MRTKEVITTVLCVISMTRPCRRSKDTLYIVNIISVETSESRNVPPADQSDGDGGRGGRLATS